MNLLVLTLPGAAITYNGEEIGMMDLKNISWEDTKDPAACNTNSHIYHLYTRDPERTPYQWDSSLNAGFSKANVTWLPVNPNYNKLNLQLQQIAEKSNFKFYQKIAELRKHITMIYGSFHPVALSTYVIGYTRLDFFFILLFVFFFLIEY